MILNNFTLLYVEDDKDTADAISGILTECVKELYIARDGEEGLEVYNEKSPDIVLTDIGMPKLNGIEMAAKIKEINYHQPIVVLTAFNDMENLKSCVDIGIDRYILKPLESLDKLLNPLETISKVLQLDKNKIAIEKMFQTQNKISSMGEMLSNIAHQWRQPLSVISTYASGLKLKTDLDIKVDNSELQKCATTVVDSVQQLSAMIDDFRGFFDDINIKISDFNVKDVVLEVEDFVASSYKLSNIKVITCLEDVTIFNNKNQLIQALLNIFNNAKDSLVSNEIEDRYFFINMKKNEDYLNITLTDNGGGIEDSAIDKIFEPYFTTKHQFMGTGLGLYLTYQIISKHYNGEIYAQNKEFEYNGKTMYGACFEIVLQLQEKAS